MREELPREIADLLPPKRLEHLLFCVPTDIDDGGHAAALWLIATKSHLIVASEADASGEKPARLLRSIPYDQIGGYRVVAEVGSGYLQIKREEVWVDVLRYTNTLAAQFREVAHKLEQFRRRGQWNSADEVERSHECPSCGSRLPLHCDVCLTCAPNSKTFARVAGLLRPYAGTTAVIGVLSIIAVAIELAPPMLQKVLVDSVLEEDRDRTNMGQLLGMLAAIVAGLAVVRLLAAALAVWKAR